MPDVITPEPTVTPEPSPPPTPPAPTPPAPEYKYSEDRSNWLPPDRYRAAEAATNKAAREALQWRTQYEDANRRIAALAGVTPKAPEAEEQEKIARAFYALPQFAHLRGLTPQVMERLMAMTERGDEYEQGIRYQWDRLRDRTFKTVVEHIQDTLGLDTIDPDMAEDIHGMFRQWARSQPDQETFRLRYEAEDPKLMTEFLDRYKAKHIDPIRRSAAASLARPAQARVPRGGPSQPVVTQKPKRDYSKMTNDDARQAAEDDAVAYLRENGMLQGQDDRW